MKYWLLLILLLPVGYALEGYEDPRSGFSADTQVAVLDTAVYNTGYVSADGTDWQAFSLSGQERGSWVVGEATADVDLTGVRYVAIYSCSWNSGWSCGNTWQVRDRDQINTTGSILGDYQALMQLYQATNGDDWWDNTGWQTSTPETMNDMYGITVYPTGHEFAGRVQQIDLFQNNLVGNIENVSFNKLTATQNLTLKQPLTEQEFFASNPDGQIATTPPQKISGKLPKSIGAMKNLAWLSLGGQYCKIDIEHGFNEWNHCAGFGSGKKFVHGNSFEGELPSEWGSLENLQMLEIRRSNLQGTVPNSWEGMTSLLGIFLNGNRLEGLLPPFENSPSLRHIHLNYNGYSQGKIGFYGEIPASYGQLENLSHLRLRGNSLTGDIPDFSGPTNLYVFDVARNDVTRFPIEIFQEGRNPRLVYFYIQDNPITGALEDYDINPENHNFVVFAPSGHMTGIIPSWASDMSIIQFNFQGNKFTSLGEGFYNPQANIYRQTRLMMLYNNQLRGELPDVLFAGVSFTGTATGMSSSNTIQLDQELGIIESGTISSASSSWFRDTDKTGVWTGPYTDHIVTIDPDGRNIEFRPPVDWNWEKGYLYSQDQADVSQTVGLTYIIRPDYQGRIIRFKIADNRWVARTITAVNREENSVVLDKPLPMDITGLSYHIHKDHSALLYAYYSGNNFTGSIPQSWGYIPTNRELEIRVHQNDLSGEIPDLSSAGNNHGGNLNKLLYFDNRFVFKDIIPNFAANDAATAEHRYAPQKPFGPKPWGETHVIQANTESAVEYNDLSTYVNHPDNRYQWEKDGVDLAGQTSVTLSISSVQSSDEGIYRLRVTNPNVAGLTLYSKDIELAVS